jgi:hypothetical protein
MPALKGGISGYIAPPFRLPAGAYPSDQVLASGELQCLCSLLEGHETLGGIEVPDGC